jgi:hypothetical protein
MDSIVNTKKSMKMGREEQEPGDVRFLRESEECSSPDSLRILIAHELLYYSEVIANAIRMLRPNLVMITREPEVLDHEISVFGPDLVVCSLATPTIRDRCFAWVELYPGHEALAVVCINGQVSTVNDFELDDLLSIIDRQRRSDTRTQSPDAQPMTTP